MRTEYDYLFLKSRMDVLGYSQKDLANATNISMSALSKKLNNKNYFSQPEIDRICKVLNIKNENKLLAFFTKKASE